MYFYKLTLSYNGADFYGWQIQPKLQTIQGELNRALCEIARSSQISSQASGRTDAGVHALAQIVKISIPIFLPEQGLVKAINSHLPKSIRVLSAESSTAHFRPVQDAKSKCYRYYFTNEQLENPFMADLIANVRYQLNFDHMQRGCKAFIGTYDFKAFRCLGTEVRSTIRTISECRLEKVTEPFFLLPNCYYIEFIGNGFLKQMVRMMVGALFDLARDRISIENIVNALQTPQQTIAPVAPPCGLYLVEVRY